MPLTRILYSLLFCLGLLSAKAQTKSKEVDTYVVITTDFGQMKVRLYNQTPQHRDNFIKLVKEGYYDGTLFHRVIKDFMIQGGDPDSKNSAPGAVLGNGGPGYTVPAEFIDSLYHKKGVLAAARIGDQANPTRASSGSQFYIVQGKSFSESDLKRFEDKINQDRMNSMFNEFLNRPENNQLKRMIDGWVKVGNQNELNYLSSQIQPQLEQQLNERGRFKYSAKAIEDYQKLGGAPHLDGAYTVFGEVVEGLDVIDKIAAQNCGANDRPNQDVKMSIKISKK